MSTVATSPLAEGNGQEECHTPKSPGGRAARAQNKHRQRQLAEEQRQAMIENFDLEVEDKIRAMMAQLEADKMDLQLRADCEIAQLPKCVRDMPLKAFMREYGGDVSAAVRGVLGLDGQGCCDPVSVPETPLVIRARRKAAAHRK
ncbi:hypothetical protein LPJ61_007091 [Coemansia biformis]|uniref:Borealin N-terminal domain-containing protein n=1 Tax=Coemansia biformis TaxID=1286918 RepID=A0A9W7XSR4_9FUNG|nr:hypothetical protein LPJ61_007091 [Coemansia biformis]